MTTLKTIVGSMLARLAPKKVPVPSAEPQRTAKHFIPAFVELPGIDEADDYSGSAYN